MLCQCSFMHDTEFIIYSNIFLSNIHIACWVRFFSAQLFFKSMFYERIGRGSHDQKEWLQHKILDQRPFLWKHMPTLNFFDASSFHNFTRESNILWDFGYKQIQSTLVNSNSDNSNFRLTRSFPLVPTFFLYKVTKFTPDNSNLVNSKYRLTRSDFQVPMSYFI